MNHKSLLIFLLLCIQSALYGQKNSRTFLFVGTYTDGKPGLGIYVYEFNPETGDLKRVSNTENITNPSFVTISPNGGFLYACTDTKMPNAGSVSGFRIDSTNGRLSFINSQRSGGENPVYLTVHRSNKFLVNGNYTGGTVSVFTMNENGSLNPSTQVIQFVDSSVIKIRQDKSHIHSTVFSPLYDFIFLPDLGADKIRAFKFDSINPKPLLFADNLSVKTVPGSGPRHFTFHPSKPYAYCIEELSGMVSVYSYKQGKLDSSQRIFSYSKTQDSYGGADIHISPDGRFLYASNRGENTVSMFSIDQSNGQLHLLGHQPTFGDHPRNFAIDPDGNFLLVANQLTNNIIVFKIDRKTGLLTKTGKEITVPQPSCLKMRKYGN